MRTTYANKDNRWKTKHVGEKGPGTRADPFWRGLLETRLEKLEKWKFLNQILWNYTSNTIFWIPCLETQTGLDNVLKRYSAFDSSFCYISGDSRLGVIVPNVLTDASLPMTLHFDVNSGTLISDCNFDFLPSRNFLNACDNFVDMHILLNYVMQFQDLCVCRVKHLWTALPAENLASENSWNSETESSTIYRSRQRILNKWFSWTIKA